MGYTCVFMHMTSSSTNISLDLIMVYSNQCTTMVHGASKLESGAHTMQILTYMYMYISNFSQYPLLLPKTSFQSFQVFNWLVMCMKTHAGISHMRLAALKSRKLISLNAPLPKTTFQGFKVYNWLSVVQTPSNIILLISLTNNWNNSTIIK